MPTYCVQCGVEHQARTAVGVDEDGQPACAAHVAPVNLEPDEVPENHRETECHCGGKLGHKGRHRNTCKEPKIQDAAQRKNGVTLRDGLQEVLDGLVDKRAELSGKIQALQTVIEMLDHIEAVGKR
jgi:hypothetical protein